MDSVFSKLLEKKSSIHWKELEDDVRYFAISQNISARKLPQQNGLVDIYNLPVTLFPTKIKTECFNSALATQKLVNELIYKISNDHDFLENSLKKLTAADPFVGQLYKIYETVRRRGYAATHQLGIFRSDYIIDEYQQLKQVEVNTISVSFAGLAPSVERLHRYNLKHYSSFDDSQINSVIPENSSLSSVAQALIEAHSVYSAENSAILFLIQQNEANVMDQKLIEWQIKKQCNVLIYRKTFSQLDQQISLGPNNELLLHINSQNVEIGVVYFRTAYTVKNFSYNRSWLIRLMIEQSRAIKCPSIQFQLAGFKKFQTLLCDRSVFDRYVGSHYDSDTVNNLFNTFVKFWSIDQVKPSMAADNHQRYVLKSNLEGGGNNYFGKDIAPKLQQIAAQHENEAYFLMEFIKQQSNKNVVIRAQESDSTEEPGSLQLSPLKNELGIYGAILIESNANTSGNNPIVFNRNAGHLLRSKHETSNEVGIVSSGGVLDSPLLF